MLLLQFTIHVVVSGVIGHGSWFMVHGRFMVRKRTLLFGTFYFEASWYRVSVTRRSLLTGYKRYTSYVPF